VVGNYSIRYMVLVFASFPYELFKICVTAMSHMRYFMGGLAEDRDATVGRQVEKEMGNGKWEKMSVEKGTVSKGAKKEAYPVDYTSVLVEQRAKESKIDVIDYFDCFPVPHSNNYTYWQLRQRIANQSFHLLGDGPAELCGCQFV
jgi:hypothetical protein